MSLAGVLLGGIANPQEPPAPSPRPPEPQAPAAQEPAEQTESPQEGQASIPEPSVGPSPGAVTLSLAQAVNMALQGNFGILSSADSLSAARFRESAAKAQFYPKLTPSYSRNGSDSQTTKLDL